MGSGKSDKGGHPPGKGSTRSSGAHPAPGESIAADAPLMDPVSLPAFLASHRRPTETPADKGRRYCERCHRPEIRPPWLAREACSVCRGPLSDPPALTGR